ncbi:MAG: methyltransferase [Oscillospiraceae bacterium]|jgi:tRNA1(Val) A37 N6-methylase TrmN6|nr:methyltransferase [Oscillospiraceae bacterium]
MDTIFPITTDALLLAAFAAQFCKARKLRVLELGCGGGIVAVELAAACPNVSVVGVEINEDAANSARELVAAQGLSERITILNADLRTLGNTLGVFDVVVANPPYFERGRGRRSNSNTIAAAKSEESATLADFCSAAAKSVRNGGAFISVMRASRLSDLFRELARAGFEPKRMQLVARDANSAPTLALTDARRGGGAGLDVLPMIFTQKEQ